MQRWWSTSKTDQPAISPPYRFQGWSGYSPGSPAGGSLPLPNLAGWSAPFSANIILTTAGSSFQTALGVYTGTTVSKLTLVAGDINSGGPNTSRLTFGAVVGTEYQIAVGGVTGANGNITLNLSVPALIAIAAVSQRPDGTIEFDVVDEPKQTNRVEGSTDLLDWVPLTPFMPNSGTLRFNDPE